MLNEGEEKSDKISIKSKSELKEEILNFANIKLVIIFGNIMDTELVFKNSIQAPSVNELFLKKALKKDLWLKIKSKLNL